MNEQELRQLILSGATVSLIVEAIHWPHQAMRRNWDLANWQTRSIPGALLLWRTAAPPQPDTPSAQRLRELGDEERQLESERHELRRGGSRYSERERRERGDAIQARLNAIPAERRALRLLPDAPPEERMGQLATEIVRLRGHREQVATWRRDYGDADAARLGPDEIATEAEIAQRQAELDAIPANPPVAGILLVNADESRRDEYTPLAAQAGYPITLLMRGQWTPGPARTIADAITEGILR